jgi:hypothetical protein
VESYDELDWAWSPADELVGTNIILMNLGGMGYCTGARLWKCGTTSDVCGSERRGAARDERVSDGDGYNTWYKDTIQRSY